MDENREKEVLYSVKEFLGEGMSAIQADVTLNKYFEKDLLRWVNVDSNIIITDGRKCIDLDVDFWDVENRGGIIERLKRMAVIFTEMATTLEGVITIMPALEAEAKANRETLDTVTAL